MSCVTCSQLPCCDFGNDDDDWPGGLRQCFGSIKESDEEGEGKEQLCQEQESDVGRKVGDNGDGGDGGYGEGGDGDVVDGDDWGWWY